jgi:methyl-accepting chemotaxis protein
MSQINDHATTISQTNLPTITNLANARGALLKTTNDLRQSILDPDPQSTAQDIQLTKQDAQAMQDALATYLALPHSASEEQGISTLQQALTTWQTTVQQMEVLSAANSSTADAQLMVSTHQLLTPQTNAVFSALSSLIALSQQDAANAHVAAENTFHQLAWVLVALSIVAVVVALLLARFLNVYIVFPLRNITHVVQRMAGGELTSNDDDVARYGGKDATGELVLAVHHTLEKLRELIGRVTKMSQIMAQSTQEIGQAAHQTEAASSQVAEAIQQVAAGAQDQSTQLAQAATGVNNLTKQNTILQHYAHETLQTMETLKSTISATANRVKTLGEHSATIGQIAQTIDEISEQTNLLALNAAIEAARAGEHGRGFAVVADEVRKLAERAGASTQEIRNIIAQTQTQTAEAVTAMEAGVMQVEEGVVRVANTEEQTREMANRAHDVEEVVTAASSVSKENSTVAEQVSAATEEMAAQVTETLSTTQKIEAIALELHAAAKIFHWAYADDWRARGMVPSDNPLPWHPVPASATENPSARRKITPFKRSA